MDNEQLEKPVENEAEELVIYKQDRPFLTLLRNFSIVAGISIATLVIFGLFIGFTGGRIPYIDQNVIGLQWGNVTGNGVPPFDWNELDKP